MTMRLTAIKTEMGEVIHFAHIFLFDVLMNTVKQVGCSPSVSHRLFGVRL